MPAGLRPQLKVKAMRSYLKFSLILIAELSWGQPGASQNHITTVAEILKNLEKFDGAQAELHGKILIGYETSAFEDASSCKGIKVMTCAI